MSKLLVLAKRAECKGVIDFGNKYVLFEVNCSFYFKIGACRHGNKCSRVHNRPTFSQTVLLQNFYHNPQFDPKAPDPYKKKVTEADAQEQFDDFFEEVFVEVEDEYGELEELNVCDNVSEHLIGNTYIKFRYETDAARAVKDLNNRWFNRNPIYAELSPVTDFREACCRQYEMGECTRGGFCNFMHLKPISRELKRELYLRKHQLFPKGRFLASTSSRSDNTSFRLSETPPLTSFYRIRNKSPGSNSGSSSSSIADKIDSSIRSTKSKSRSPLSLFRYRHAWSSDSDTD